MPGQFVSLDQVSCARRGALGPASQVRAANPAGFHLQYQAINRRLGRRHAAQFDGFWTG